MCSFFRCSGRKSDRRLRAPGVLSIVRSGGARNIPLCTAAVGKDVDFGDLVVAGGNADQGEGLAGRRDQESGVPLTSTGCEGCQSCEAV
jgi:hypothetical protein